MAKQSRPSHPGTKLVQAYIPASTVNRFRAAVSLRGSTVSAVLASLMDGYATGAGIPDEPHPQPPASRGKR